MPTHIATDGHHGTWRDLPSLDEFLKEIEWQPVGIGQTEKAFGFRVAIESKQWESKDQYEFDPPDGGYWPTLLALTEFGLAALELAGRFRKSKWLGPAPIPNPQSRIDDALTLNRAAPAPNRASPQVA